MGKLETIRSLQEKYLQGKNKIVPTIESYLKRCKEDKTNSWISLSEERALQKARSLEEVLLSGSLSILEKYPLLGIPLGIKDAIHVKGVRSTGASKILENYVPPFDATVVSRLENAGAVILGKLNMDEFAMGSSNENSAFGPVQHPTHPGRVPGGSSGASAVTVKLGQCVAALGTDTGGSVRLPSSFCGVVGLKPSYGRVSRFGLTAFASSLDQISPIATTVEDCARVFDVMAGMDPKDSTMASLENPKTYFRSSQPVDWKKLSIGVPKEYFVKGVDPDVIQGVQSTLDWMKSQGAKLVPIELPHTQYAVSTYYVIAVSEASSNLSRFDGVRYGTRVNTADHSIGDFYLSNRTLFGPEPKRRILLGTFALSSGYYDAYYLRACKVRRLVQKDFLDAFGKVDFIVGPVSPVTAFEQGAKAADPLKMYLVDAYTVPASLSGLPAISLPCAKDSQRLPIGLQVIGKQFQEEALLQLAASIYDRHLYE